MEPIYQLMIAGSATVVLDYATGLIKAAVKREIDSAKMRLGLWHKSAYVLAVALALVCEMTMRAADLGFTVPLVTPVLVYIILTEVASIIENLGEINPDLKATAFVGLFKSSKRSENDD